MRVRKHGDEVILRKRTVSNLRIGNSTLYLPLSSNPLSLTL